MRRHSDARVVRSAAYRLGRALADPPRIVTGQVPTGSPIVLTTRDPAQRYIYFLAAYEPEVTAVFYRLVRPGTTVFDVGANAAYFSLVSRDLGASVHAFEPNPTLAALIRRSIALAGERLTLVEAAASSSEGRMTLHLSEGTTAMSSLDPEVDGLSGATVEVDVTTLDAYVERTGVVPDLVKIDVERHERAVIEGASKLLASRRPAIIAEITDRPAFDMIIGHGYAAWRIERHGTVAATALHEDGWGNYLFEPIASGPAASR